MLWSEHGQSRPDYSGPEGRARQGQEAPRNHTAGDQTAGESPTGGVSALDNAKSEDKLKGTHDE